MPIRMSAVSALKSLKSEKATELLCKAAKDDEWPIRETAISLLAKRARSNNVDIFISALGDSDFPVRIAALSGISKLLKGVSKKAESPAIGNIPIDELSEKITPLLDDSEIPVQTLAIEIAGKILAILESPDSDLPL